MKLDLSRCACGANDQGRAHGHRPARERPGLWRYRSVVPILLLIGSLSVCSSVLAQTAEVVPMPKEAGSRSPAKTDAVGFSPGGKYLWALVGEESGKLLVWRAQDRTLVFSHRHPMAKAYYYPQVRPAWSSDDSAVAVAEYVEEDRRVRFALIDPASGKVRSSIDCPSELEKVRSITLSPSGDRLIALGGQDHTDRRYAPTVATVYRLDTSAVARSFEVHSLDDKLAHIAVSPDGRVMAAAVWRDSGAPGGLRLFDLGDGRLLGKSSMPSASSYTLGFRSGGRELLAIGDKGQTVLWDVSEPGRPAAKPVPSGLRLGADLRLSGVSLAADGCRAALGCPDEKRVIVANAEGGKHYPLSVPDINAGLGLSADGDLLLTGGTSLRLWRVGDLAVAIADVPTELCQLKSRVWGTGLGVSPDGSALTVNGDPVIAVSAVTGRRIGEVPPSSGWSFTERAHGKVYGRGPAGLWMQRLAGGEPETALPLAALSAAQPAENSTCSPLNDGHHFLIFGQRGGWAAVDDEGRKVAAGDEWVDPEVWPLSTPERLILPDKGLVLDYDLKTGERRGSVRLPSGGRPLALGPGGDRVFGVDGAGKAVWRWNTLTGMVDFPFSVFDSDGASVGLYELAAAGQSPCLATADRNGMVRVWDSETGACIAIRQAPGELLGLAVSPDGRRIYAAVTAKDGARLVFWKLTELDR